ncbi:hypothetical protein G5C60_49965 [Streptomyces sp. HC44]|uniref:Uncharacterized protein n=2 Tax=Streptomyces scabichelini TaxID=2711217 RepID=A0A6G4VNY8_9ACTN|nr:hypothetical protein [Streptomyces scabichelini]
MPLFRRADWPRDHRDEVVAGVLVGAVVIVLGYASGIGATTPDSARAVAPPPLPPATSAPPAPAPADSAPGAVQPGGQVPVGGGVLPGGMGELPVGGGGHAGHGSTGGAGSGHGHDGDGTNPPGPKPPGSARPEPPGDSGDTSCEDGEVRLVRPLLTGVAGLGGQLLDIIGNTGETGTDATGTDDASAPEPQPSPCVGLATPEVTPKVTPEVTP